MPRRRTSTALLLAALLLVPLTACGGGNTTAEDAADYLYSCPLQVTNGTAKQLMSFQWILVERRDAGDVLWGSLGRNPNEVWSPGLELTVVLGPNYAEPFDPSRLEWEVTFTDSEDVDYGPWTVPLTECGSTDITVTPADAN